MWEQTVLLAQVKVTHAMMHILKNAGPLFGQRTPLSARMRKLLFSFEKPSHISGGPCCPLQGPRGGAGWRSTRPGREVDAESMSHCHLQVSASLLYQIQNLLSNVSTFPFGVGSPTARACTSAATRLPKQPWGEV